MPDCSAPRPSRRTSFSIGRLRSRAAHRCRGSRRPTDCATRPDTRHAWGCRPRRAGASHCPGLTPRSRRPVPAPAPRSLPEPTRCAPPGLAPPPALPPRRMPVPMRLPPAATILSPRSLDSVCALSCFRLPERDTNTRPSRCHGACNRKRSRGAATKWLQGGRQASSVRRLYAGGLGATAPTRHPGWVRPRWLRATKWRRPRPGGEPARPPRMGRRSGCGPRLRCRTGW